MKNQDQDGGDAANMLQAARDIVGTTIVQHNHYGITEEHLESRVKDLIVQLRRESVELWRQNAPRLVRAARETHDHRAIRMTGEVIARTITKDPELLERFGEPRAQVALLKAQEAYGETGDDELGAILAGLVVDLVSVPTRSRREIVLREAIECAPRLTSQHLSALSVVVLLKNMQYKRATDVDTLLTAMDSDFQPYYGKIPTDTFEYGYLGATAAGSFLPGLGDTVYNTVYQSHPNAMYPPIHPDEFPEEWTSDETFAADLTAMFWFTKADPIEDSRLNLKPDSADIVLRKKLNAEPPLSESHKKVRKFLEDRSISAADFEATLRSKRPTLAAFFDLIDTTLALHFQHSPVGSMLARHEIAARSPEAAAEMDKLFIVKPAAE